MGKWHLGKLEKRKTCHKEKGEMNEGQKKELLAMLIADAEKVLNIRDEGPLEDDFDSLKNYYTDLEEKILHSQGTILDLSGKEIIPSESFFIVDKERDIIYPFSLNDIPTLLSDGKNPYTSKNIDKEKIRKIQIVLGEQKSIQKIGGMLEVFSGLDKPAEIVDSWEDINTDVDIERVRLLQQKAIKVIESKNITEMCKQIQTFTKEEVLYLSSPILWGIYLVCVEDKYPEDEETIEFLESKGVKYNMKKAIQHDNEGVVKYIFEKNKSNILELMDFACKNGYINFVKIALNNGAYPRENYLLEASKNGHTEIVELLLEKGADIHAYDDRALVWATNGRHIETVRLLLEKGANVHANNDEALRIASGNDDAEIIRLLLDNGANINVFNGNELIWAIANNHVKFAKILIQNGLEINFRDGPLKIAVQHKRKEMVQFLLDHGADVNIDNGIALLVAIHDDNLPMVKLLVQNGADLHARDFMKAAYSKEMKHYIKQHL